MSGKGSGKERKLQQSEAKLNRYGQDFQKPSIVLYIHSESLVKNVISKANVQGFPQVRTRFSYSLLVYKEKLHNKYKMVNTFYQVNYVLLELREFKYFSRWLLRSQLHTAKMALQSLGTTVYSKDEQSL